MVLGLGLALGLVLGLGLGSERLMIFKRLKNRKFLAVSWACFRVGSRAGSGSGSSVS